MRFDSTRWSLVLQAQNPGEEARQALEELCQTYWRPLYSYARRRGCSVEDAQDYTQSFFLALVDKDFLQSVDAEKGRFRTFLLTAFSRFIGNERKRANAQKRGGTALHFSFDWDEGERLQQQVSKAPLDPEQLFNRQWALNVIDNAVEKLEKDYRTGGRKKLFDAISPVLTPSGDMPPYQQIADELDMTIGALKVAIHRLRARFGEKIREEVAETVSHPDDLDAEIHFLMDSLAR